MVLKEWIKNWKNQIIAGTVVLLLLICGGWAFDYYYDLNDDVLMKDILAGVYTGVPEGHNIQMLWPISAFISLLYRMAGSLPWYGIFLCFCHFGCIFLIVRRSVSLCGSLWGKLGTALAAASLFGAFFMEHLMFAQYTVTCTLLGAAAAFLFYTTDIRLDNRQFILKNIPAVLLVAAAYLIRSEMLLLVLPMICVAGAAKWGSEEKIFTWEHARKYFSVFGLLLFGIILGQAVHMIAYSSGEWKTFTEFFNNRTELYDFQAPPDYGEHKEFYDSIGLTESEKILLDNYNFGMDEEIDEKMVGEIAAYAGRVRSQEKPFFWKLKEKVKEYVYRSIHGKGEAGSDYPWNYLVILGYAAVFVTGLPKKKGKNAWKLLLLFAVRTALWMYILMGERAPERITHSLYLMEFTILSAMLLMEWKELSDCKTARILGCIWGAALTAFGLAVLPGAMSGILAAQQERALVNGPYNELYAYLSSEENQENFYLIDVYSSVSYSEKMFENVDNTLDNYDIMGGWACKSPLQKKKLECFGITNMEEALREREDVYFVRKKGEDMEWLEEYYEGHGTPVTVNLVNTVAEEFEIYSVSGVE